MLGGATYLWNIPYDCEHLSEQLEDTTSSIQVEKHVYSWRESIANLGSVIYYKCNLGKIS